MKRRPRWLVVGGVVLIVGAVAAIGVYYYAETIIESRLRPATIDLLSKRFDSHVEIGAMHITFTPGLSIRAEGLTMRHQGRTDIPPLITLREFTISAGIRQLWSRRIDRIHVDGLEFVIPPRRTKDMPPFSKPSDDKPAPSLEGVAKEDDDVQIGELIAENSLFTIMSKREGKGPRVFQIREVRFRDFEFSKAIPFQAAVTNPVPYGEIETSGTFGPWAAQEPSLTPIDGTFVFDADLGTVKGIGGAMHAEGKFSGPLELIRTSGRTKTEGFHLSSGGTKFPLHVDYDALVDATNGDTTLERVDALLGTSRILAGGEIVKVDSPKGRRITLETKARGGKLEDFVKLTTRVPSSPMTGIVNVDARLDIPPGEAEVIERMHLDGTFNVATARFTSETIQSRVDELSRRGTGRPTDQTIDDVASNLRGTFRINNARLDLRALTFRVDGATVQLAGSYDITREILNFKGELRLAAKASQTQTGWKRFVLKIFDPMLDGKGAGTVLPISVTGTRDQPKFAADLKKAILH